jgi:hypothetical protein
VHSTDSPTAGRLNAHQIKVAVVLGLEGFILTFAAYTLLLHLLGAADDSVGGFLLVLAGFLRQPGATDDGRRCLRQKKPSWHGQSKKR